MEKMNYKDFEDPYATLEENNQEVENIENSVGMFVIPGEENGMFEEGTIVDKQDVESDLTPEKQADEYQKKVIKLGFGALRSLGRVA